MVIAGVALIVALIALRKWDVPLFGITASDVDVTNMLSVLVTVLVGWQIWQGIDANNRLKRMESSVADATKRDTQLRHLLEAFQLNETAQAENTLGSRYAQSVSALRSFILSGVPSAYMPIRGILSRLNSILNEVEVDTDRANRAMFATVNRDCDLQFQTILSAINEQIGIYQDILEDIRIINRRRVSLNEPFDGLDPLEVLRNP